MTTGAMIERVELRCSNVELSAEYYSRLVGLEIVELGAERALLGAPGAPPVLSLRRAEQPGRAPQAATGLFHTAFLYPERAALGAALRRIDELGAAFSGASDHGVSEALYLDDPDGLGIELYWDRPKQRWPQPEPGQRAAMFTRPLDLGGLAATASEASGEPGSGVLVGHVHLKVAEIDAAERFWIERAGAELMTRYGSQASFLAWDGYHHHIGVNSWQSLGAAPEPAEGPGLDGIALSAAAAAEPATTPEGVPVAVGVGD